MNAEPICYLNGTLVPLAEAKVGIRDLGMVRGFGIYEGIAAFLGEPFHLADHWERFTNSAQALGLAIPATEEAVCEAIRSLVARNAPGPRANIRLVLTGGEAENGLEHVPGRETLFLTAEPFVPLPSALYERGGHLIIHEHQRFMPEMKTINYITAVTLQAKRRAERAIEILYTDGDRVLECATSNVFMIKNGHIVTPDEGVLKGVTRKVTLELARDAYPTEERTVSLDELADADEAFITSSFKDILPIRSIDDCIIGSGAPGPVTRDLMTRFAEYTNLSQCAHQGSNLGPYP